jgi:murein L,D-transpeptidase YafK
MKSLILCLMCALMTPAATAADIPTSARAQAAIGRVKPALVRALGDHGLTYGAPIFIRIFKRPGVLELWVQADDGRFRHFRDYPVCTFSGDLGPKLREGDRQSPEGFYYVGPGALNPSSRFHLSFNLGYPNAYDRAHGRTGSALMVHGNCVSVGCYAMTDARIEEIYTLAQAALEGGQPFFRVHVFPFPLDEARMRASRGHRWYDFWQNLKAGYDAFERHGRPPRVDVVDGRYVIGVDPG